MKRQLQTFILPKAGTFFSIRTRLTKLFFFILGFFLFNTCYGQADFYAEKTTVLAGDTVQFFDYTSVSGTTLIAWSWTFTIMGGTPITSTLQNPRMVFLTPGIYNVTLVPTLAVGFPLPIASKTGYITVNDASVGNDNAALVDMIGPKMVDPGIHDVKVKLRNKGENTINTVNINWQLNGVLQTPVLWTLPLDTINGVSPMEAIVTLGSTTLLAGSALPLKVWTSAPNGMPDSQMSNDTINFILRPKLSGNYTIGGVNPDFATLTDAARGLKSDYGIGGPVVFKIRDGVYNENISLNNISTTPVNTLLFKSENNNRSLVTIKPATSRYSNYAIEIKNSNNISLKHLSIISTGTFYARGIVISGSSSFLSMEDCYIAKTSNATLTYTGADSVAPVFGKLLTGTNITIKNNIITDSIGGGASGYCMSFSGADATNLLGGLVVDSNNFTCYNTGLCVIVYANAPKWRYNTVTGINNLTGLTVQGCLNNIEVANNKLFFMNGSQGGIAINDCKGTALDYAKIANNQIVIQSPDRFSWGLGGSQKLSSYIEYCHNSVHVFATDSNASRAAVFTNLSATSIEIIIKNNVFANTSTAPNHTGAAIYLNNAAYGKFDYNLLYSTSPTNLITTPTIYSTLNAYRAAFPTQEKKSITYRPAFTSNTNLEPNVFDTACWLMNGMGTHTTVTTDLLGKNRPAAALSGAPDLGAYQFTPMISPPRATPVPTVSVSGQSQAFMYGSDTVAVIEWNTLSTTPAIVDIRSYSDSAIGVYPAQLQLRSYMNVNMTPAAAYSYNVRYFYRTPLLGNIVNEHNMAGAKLAGGTWLAYTSGTTILDTLNNKMKVSALTNNQFDFTGTDKFLPLPVKLISFDALVQDKDVLLLWSTASEVNNLGFELERSEDGHTFTYVDFVKGIGNSNKTINYTLVDRNTLAKSPVLYYRLKQVDANGEFTYSKTVRVSRETQSLHSVSIIPNPCSDVFNIAFNSTGDHTISVEVMDIQGRSVLKQIGTVSSGRNTIPVAESAELRSGIYFVRLNANGETQILKLVKN